MTYEAVIMEALEDLGCATSPEIGRLLEGRGAHIRPGNLSRILQSLERFGFITNLGMTVKGPGSPSARWRLTA